MKYIPQYVYYNLLAHILFLTSSYVLVSVLYRHLEDCPRNASKDKNRKVHGLTLVEKDERTKKMKEKLLSNKEIKSVEEMYTCTWSKLRKEGEVKDFLDNHFSKRPLDRLKPRV